MTENGTERLLISVPETARRLSIGKNLCYELIADGTLPSVKLGRRRLVSVAALTSWISRQDGVGDQVDDVVPLPQSERVRKE